MIETLVDHAEQVNILQNIQVIVGGCAVRAERDIDALLQHFRNVRVAGCQLEIACRTAGDRNIVLLEDIEILVLQPDAVRRRGRRIENAVRLHVRRRRQAMTLLALLVLGLRLGQVDVDTRTRVLRMGGYRLDHLGRRGILAVDTQITDQPTAHLAVPLVQQAQIVLIGGKALVVAVVKYGQAAAEVALDAALADGGHHAIEEEIHIRERNRTARQHFRDGKLRTVVRRLVVDLVLKRKYLLTQPALQRQIFRVAAQQCHGRVAVYVVEAAHQQTGSAIVAFAVILLRLGIADVGNLAVLHADVLPAFALKILIQQINIAKKHCFLLFSL